MRLTDEQVREIKAYAERIVGAELMSLAQEHRELLLADREALLAEFAVIKAHAAERIAARDGQIENGAKMIAKLMAENAKLRKVAKDHRALTDAISSCRDRMDSSISAAWSQSLVSLSYLEAANVLDATDDKG